MWKQLKKHISRHRELDEVAEITGEQDEWDRGKKAAYELIEEFIKELEGEN